MWHARGTSELAQRTDATVLLRAEHAVAHVLATAEGEDDVHPRLLAAIGEALGWDFGALWGPTDDDPTQLRCVLTWVGAALSDDNFARVSRQITLGPGEGMPGLVWDTGSAAWIANADEYPRKLPRAQAAAARVGVEIATIAGYTDFTAGRAAAEVPFLEMQVAYVASLARMLTALDASARAGRPLAPRKPSLGRSY